MHSRQKTTQFFFLDVLHQVLVQLLRTPKVRVKDSGHSTQGNSIWRHHFQIPGRRFCPPHPLPPFPADAHDVTTRAVSAPKCPNFFQSFIRRTHRMIWKFTKMSQNTKNPSKRRNINNFVFSARGYGFSDKFVQEPVKPNTPMLAAVPYMHVRVHTGTCSTQNFTGHKSNKMKSRCWLSSDN